MIVAILFLGAVILSGSLVVAKNISEGESVNFDELYKKYGQTWGVNWMWLKAIALNESNNGKEKSVRRGIENPNDVEGSKSSDGKSWGLMQVTLTTARDMDASATPQKLNNPEYSINLAARYIKQFIMPRFSTSDPRYLEYVIKSYNQGVGNTLKYDAKGITRPEPWGSHVQTYWERFKRNLNKVALG